MYSWDFSLVDFVIPWRSRDDDIFFPLLPGVGAFFSKIYNIMGQHFEIKTCVVSVENNHQTDDDHRFLPQVYPRSSSKKCTTQHRSAKWDLQHHEKWFFFDFTSIVRHLLVLPHMFPCCYMSNKNQFSKKYNVSEKKDMSANLKTYRFYSSLI